MRNILKFGFRGLTCCLAALACFLAVIHISHLMKFGHLGPFGMHAEFSVRNEDFGIPGITKAYNPILSNLGPFPKKVRVCDFVTDAMAHGVAVAYDVQKWNSGQSRWDTIVVSTPEVFCKPFPLGISESQVISKTMWPGQRLENEEEATAARGLQKGDVVRFLLHVGELEDRKSSFPTLAFVINEQVKPGDGFRAHH